MVSSAEEYIYSSARCHLQGEKDYLVTKSIITDATRDSYRNFFDEDDVSEEEVTKTINERAEQCKAFGGKAFMEKLAHMAGFDVNYRRRGRPLNKK